MTSDLYTLDIDHITTISGHHAKQLESGKVIFCPNLNFILLDKEQELLTPTVCDTKKKNISYDYQKQRLSGISQQNPHQQTLHTMMHRYACFAKQLVDTLLPEYEAELRWGRTSYRPAEVENRHRSKRQDDTRVHVDAFPATPVHGLRILRVFCNINPHGKSRVWHLGETFSDVLSTFSLKLARYSRLKANVLHFIKATKTVRSPYDHFMLALHDAMKLDDDYQATLEKKRVDFPAHSTWIVFTDQVSHAALGGQYLLEQTFYLPVSAMTQPQKSPLKHFETQGLI